MASMANMVKIIFASEFKAKGLQQADKAINKLNKNVRNLAAGFGVAFGARALATYSKNAVKAFADDEKAARSLTLTLKNLGLAFADPKVKQFISDMEAQYHVVDDLLRPAFQKFLTVTGSVAKSQSLLQSALNASAATGQDLDSVTTILTKAYLGQTKGLSKLGISLTQAQMKAMSFEQILTLINKTFAGQAQQAADSYKGKIDALNVSLANAQEIIGKGIIDALQTLAGDKSFNKVTTDIENMATAIADATRGIGIYSKAISESWFGQALGKVMSFNTWGNLGKELTKAGKAQRIAQTQANTGGGLGGSLSMSERLSATNARKIAEAEKKAAKERAKQLAAQKALTKAQQDALKAKKLGAIFDMDQIQVMAALQGDLSKEERKRLELQLALLQGNATEAEKLAKQLAQIQGANSLIATQLRDLPDAKNPFKSWGDYLKTIEEQIARISGAGNGTNAGDVPLIPSNVSPSYTGDIPSGYKSSYTAPPVLEINVNGDGAIANVIRDALNEAAASGKTTGWSQSATIQVLN